MPSSYATAVSATPRPPSNPATTPAIRNPPESSLNPQPSATDPYTYAAIGATAMGRMTHSAARALSSADVPSGSRIPDPGSRSRRLVAYHMVHATHSTNAAEN